MHTHTRQKGNSENEYWVSTVSNHWSIHLHPQTIQQPHPHTHTNTLWPHLPTTHTHTHTHTHISTQRSGLLAICQPISSAIPLQGSPVLLYMYVCMRVCVCMCVCCNAFSIFLTISSVSRNVRRREGASQAGEEVNSNMAKRVRWHVTCVNHKSLMCVCNNTEMWQFSAASFKSQNSWRVLLWTCWIQRAPVACLSAGHKT